MIHPLFTNARILFIEDDCDYCSLYRRFIYKLNSELRLDKRIKIIDVTKSDRLGIVDNPILLLFEKYLNELPILIIDGEIKIGATSTLECLYYLKARLINDFHFEQMPEFLPLINKYTIFNLDCKYRKGRIVCE